MREQPEQKLRQKNVFGQTWWKLKSSPSLVCFYNPSCNVTSCEGGPSLFSQSKGVGNTVSISNGSWCKSWHKSECSTGQGL